MDYKVKLQVFEGPLDLLLHLVDKAEVDIYDISIAEITDQYMTYLNAMQRFQLEVASEFLVMAATLLELKSKMLLPRKKEETLESAGDLEEEEDPRQQLMERLMAYRKYKALAEELKEQEAKQSKLYTRAALDLSEYRPPEEQRALEGISLYELVEAVSRALRRAQTRDRPMARVHRDEISVTDRIRDIQQRLRSTKALRFSELFSDDLDRSEIVVSFLAILEMMAKNQIRCEQAERYADITIRWKEN